jgi:hypothetical protein
VTAAVSTDNDDKRSRGASRKPAADAHAAKPALHETAEAKAHEQEAVEDQVRAALANVDASRTPAPNAPTPAATTPPSQTAAVPQPQAIPAPSNSAPSATTVSTATSAPPAVAVPAPPPLDIQTVAPVAASAPAAVPTSAQQTSAEPGPLTPVEIKSRPVAGVGETSPGAQATAEPSNEPDGKAKGETDKGFFATIAHLPDILRANAHPPSGDPPRPPMPVGE